MHDYDFQGLYVMLLRGGLSPRHARRAVKEIRAHFSDLESAALAEGQAPVEAKYSAQQALGDTHEIARRFLERPELRSWSHRYPKMFYLLGPLVSFCLLALVILVSYIVVLDYFFSTPEGEVSLGMPTWGYWLTQAVLAFAFYALTPLLAISYCITAKKRLMPMHWPLTGSIALTLLAAGFSYTLFAAGPGELSSLSIAWKFSLWGESNHALWKILPTLGGLASVYYWYQPDVFRAEGGLLG